MSLTIVNQVAGQQVTSTPTYMYLYEPLPILVTEDNLTARELTIKLETNGTENGTYTLIDEEYATFDINPGQSLNIDIAKIIRQAHNSNIYNFSNIDDIISANNSVIDNVTYKLSFTSDSGDNDEVVIYKLPIIGGRNFSDFNGLVDQNNPLSEFDKYGLDFTNHWKDYPVMSTVLSSPTPLDRRPVHTKYLGTGINCAHGGLVIWKSRLGGWMHWGFQLKTEKEKSSYIGNLDVGYFDTVRGSSNGQPFIPVNYTGVNIDYSLTLKSLSLSSEELRAVSSIATSPAVYYMKDPDGKIELMRLGSSTHPINNQSNGGDFTVSLSSISKMQINTR